MDGLYSLSIQDFQERRDDPDWTIVDVRTDRELVTDGVIPGAEHHDVGSNDFMDYVQSLYKDKKIVFYCRTGSRTSQILHYLREMGFTNVYDLLGGIVSWKASGGEVLGGKTI